MFLNEPLYQIYSAAKLESVTQDIDRSDGYEEVGGRLNDEMGEEEKRNHRPSALQLIEPNNGPSRTLWCEIPEVINSQILCMFTKLSYLVFFCNFFNLF
jgi:neuronal guanine nucleotide exchange factor